MIQNDYDTATTFYLTRPPIFQQVIALAFHADGIQRMEYIKIPQRKYRRHATYHNSRIAKRYLKMQRPRAQDIQTFYIGATTNEHKRHT